MHLKIKNQYIEVTRIFSLADKNILPNLKAAIISIKNLINTKLHVAS